MINIEGIKIFVYGLVLLFLFHFESLQLGPVKISHLWKGALLAYLLVVLTRGAQIKPYVYGPLLLLSILQIFNMELITNPFNAVLLFSRTIILPLLGMYAFRFSSEQLEKGLLFFATFFILCFLPYKLGLLSSLSEGYDLSKWGGDAQGLIGPFQTVHSASTALAASLLVIVYFLFKSIHNRFYLAALFFLGFYFLFATYARTGMAMFAVGLVPIVYFFGKKSSRAFLQVLLVATLSLLFVFVWVMGNETLMNKITGERVKSSEFSSFESLGSGRGLIYMESLEIYADANALEQLIGLGQTELQSRMYEKTGSALVTHNGFLTILLGNGAIGLILFFSFLHKVLRSMASSDNEELVLLKALFFAYLIMCFFQNYDMMYAMLIFMLALACFAKRGLHNDSLKDQLI